MTDSIKALNFQGLSSSWLATITEIRNRDVTVQRSDGEHVNALVALSFPSQIAIGTSVVVLQTVTGEYCVIAVVAPVSTEVSRLRDGTTVRISAEQVSVQNPEGALIFTHDPRAKRTIVNVAEGDLELRTEQGSIHLTAKEQVNIAAEHGVQVTSPHRVTLSSQATEQGPRSEVCTTANQTTIHSAQVEIKAETTEIIAKQFRTLAEKAVTVAAVVETSATRIIERAKEAYQDIEEVSQQRLGRLRILAQSTVHLLSKRTVIKADDDVKIKADKIHLA